MIHPTQLAAKVAARNNAHAYALRLYPVLSDFFRGYVGCKILKADGTLLKKIADAIPAQPEPGVSGVQLHVYRSTSSYSLAWTVKACETFPARYGDCQIASYYEVTVYIGDMRGDVLTKISDPPTWLRTDYTVEEVEKARLAYAEAKKKADDARSALGDFGEYDA